MISIHAPHEGERLPLYDTNNDTNSISIHAPHEGERQKCPFLSPFPFLISIHAPHEGERLYGRLSHPTAGYFNPRSPRGGATLTSPMMRGENVFQSTLPTRGSDPTPRRPVPRAPQRFQSTLPTRGSDGQRAFALRYPDEFQSTLPTRGSDLICRSRADFAAGISIHAPHEGERQAHRGS